MLLLNIRNSIVWVWLILTASYLSDDLTQSCIFFLDLFAHWSDVLPAICLIKGSKEDQIVKEYFKKYNMSYETVYLETNNKLFEGYQVGRCDTILVKLNEKINEKIIFKQIKIELNMKLDTKFSVYISSYIF